MQSLLAWASVGAALAADFCPTMHADFLRRQAGHPWNMAAPFTEADGAKHTPYINISGSEATVTVGDGSPYHPMSAGTDASTVHFITHIYVLDQDGGFVAMSALDPSQSSIARLTFTIPENTTALKAYEWCNLHGLWESSVVGVSPGTSAKTCGVASLAQTLWPSVHYDFELQQSWPPFSSSGPFTEDMGAKHTPYITVSGDQATVEVGDGSPYHPMVASADPNTVHFITHIYVLDQNQGIVAMKALDPNGVDMASMNFTIPAGATSLTAYEWCNKHGLWKGPTVSVGESLSGAAGYQMLGGGMWWLLSAFFFVVHARS